jgi:hypothetical protein
MKKSFSIKRNSDFFLVTKSRFTYLRDWVFFILYTILLSMGFIFIFFFSGGLENWWHKAVFILIFFLCYYLINYRDLKRVIFESRNIGNMNFIINGSTNINIGEGVSFVRYEYAGELLLKSSGNFFIKVGNKEFKICNGITDEEFLDISDSLSMFFNIEKIDVEYKVIP